MTIKKLVAGAKGAAGNSTGADIANAVNGLIDANSVNPINKPEILRNLIDSSGAVIFLSGGNTSTTEIDPLSPFGTPALKVNLKAGTGYIEVGLAGLNLTKFDGNIVFKVWVEDYTKISQFVMYAGTTGFSRLYQQNYPIASQGMYNGNRMYAVGELHKAAVSSFVTGVDTLAEVKMRMPAPPSDTTVWVQQILLPRKNKGVVMFTYDDGFIEWKTRVAPKLNEYGFKGAFAIQQNLINTANNLTSADLMQFCADGHLVVPHQVQNQPFNDNNTTGQTLAQYMTDYTTSINSLRGWTESLGSSSYFAYVQGRFNETLINAIKSRGLICGRSVSNSFDHYSCGMGAELFTMKTAYLDPVGVSVAAIKARIDNCAKYGTLLTLMGHQFSLTGQSGPSLWPIEFHDEIVDYVAEKVAAGEIIVMRPDEFARLVD